jgi:hypothetical protein
MDWEEISRWGGNTLQCLGVSEPILCLFF